MSINKTGFWNIENPKDLHSYDKNLSIVLLDFFKNENIKTIADFGCGLGDYVNHFKKNNINAKGFDGNPNTPKLTNHVGEVLDLSIPKIFDEKFDWVMSLEVGEHLPKKYEDIFINNLHNNNKNGIVLSWAIKGQGGHGHYNEQNNDYIKEKIMKLGYTNDIDAENELRKKKYSLVV
jgi:cyclopropane fatty-acyl-phospholipid synthase-like methyltransferase